MSTHLGNVEKRVLKALRDKPSATVEDIAASLKGTGASSIVEANAALARNRLVEPVPNETGAFRLTAEGERLASELPEVPDDPGSGGGDSTFN